VLISFFFQINFSNLAKSCIDIIPNELHVNPNEPIRLVCRIRPTDAFNEHNIRVQWTRNDFEIINIAECLSNYSSVDGTLYETLIIRKARKTDNGIYACRYGQLLTATSHVIVNQCKYVFFSIFYLIITIHYYFFKDTGVGKSRRLISHASGNSSLSKASTRTVINVFYIVYQMFFLSQFIVNII